MPPVPLVSLCSTSYNTEPVTRQSIVSIMEQTSGLETEIIVVDNHSSDGTWETLQSFQKRIPLTVERRHCSRGKGRQRAFELSRGEYVVTFDLDTIYNPLWGRILRWVLQNRVDFGLSAAYSQFYPRSVLAKVDGWRDLQYWEDVDLWARLAAEGLYRTYPVSCGENLKRVPGRTLTERTVRLYARNRDKVATTPHIPFSLYGAGYLRFMQKTRRPSGLYHMGIFLPAYFAGRMKRKRLWKGKPGPSILNDERLVLDLNFESREQWIRATSPYDTLEGCREALLHDDLGFLPGFFD